ncbi:MAG TPA: hypothetical protein VM575_13895 [Nocardioides sp.]|nr:hypothetical protein [Nocardioides sp.]
MTTIRLRRGTAAQWAAANPVLAQGEPGVDTTTGALRIGDGTRAWLDLPEFRDASALAAPQPALDVVRVERIGPAGQRLDPAVATYFSLELSGGVALADTGFVEGQSVTVELVQDATGGHAVTLPPAWVGAAAVEVEPSAGTLERLVVWRAAGRMNVQQAGGGPFPLAGGDGDGDGPEDEPDEPDES